MANSKRRVIIIGIDGGTLDLIQPWASEGKLPNFKRILDGGSWGKLMSTIPPLSAPAWASFMTGKNPGKHGIFDFTKYNHKSNKIEVVNRTHINAKSLWNIVSKHNKKVVIANVPMTYPPEEVNGTLISGWLAPSIKSDFTYPRDVKKEVLERAGSFMFEPNVKFYKDTERHNDLFIHELKECLSNRGKVFDFVFKEKDWDLFTFVYLEADRAQYKFWKYFDKTHPAFDAQGALKYGDAILDVYREIDKTLGKILGSMNEEDLLLIVSDHGFGPLYKTVYLNKWLEENAFLVVASDGDSGNFLKTACNAALRRIIRISRWGLFAGLDKYIDFLFPKLKDKVLSSVLFSNIDWAKTMAFSVGYGGNIYINLEGRQPAGIVKRASYEKVRAEIMEKLMKLKDPDTGEPMVDCVYKREDLFQGMFVEDAPDLLIGWKDYKYWVNLDLNVKIKKSIGLSTEDPIYKRAGDHKLFGVFCAYGNKIQRGREIKDARLVDLVPTVLYYLGMPIPSDVDGRVLREAFNKDFNAKNTIDYESQDTAIYKKISESTPSKKEQEIIEDRLKKLGYI